MKDRQGLIEKLRKFAKERDWDQFHNPKDLALAISIEAAELNELFLWKKPEDADAEKVKDELADVFAYALQLAAKYDLDVGQIVSEKIEQNSKKYPVDKDRKSTRLNSSH